MATIAPEDLQALKDAVHRLLGDQSGEAQVRATMDTASGYDPALWKQLAEMGVVGLVVDEEFGGGGAGPVELEAVMEEAGAALLCSPLLASGVLAAELLTALGDRAAATRLLPGIAAGTSIATVALTGERGLWTADGVDLTAEVGGGGWAVSGAARYVIHGQNADVLLALARAPDGLAVFEVDPKASGVEIEALPAFDHTLRLAAVRFTGAAGRLGRRAGRRRPAVPGVHRRLRQEPHPVRPGHRQLPGDQAHGRRPAAGVGIGHLRRPERRRPAGRGRAGRPGGVMAVMLNSASC